MIDLLKEYAKMAIIYSCMLKKKSYEDAISGIAKRILFHYLPIPLSSTLIAAP